MRLGTFVALIIVFLWLGWQPRIIVRHNGTIDTLQVLSFKGVREK